MMYGCKEAVCEHHIVFPCITMKNNFRDWMFVSVTDLALRLIKQFMLSSNEHEIFPAPKC